MKNGEQDNARQVVEEFCRAEFDGDDLERRAKVIAFSEAVARAKGEHAPELRPEVIQWDWDPFDVVTQYVISEISIDDSKGYANVIYSKVAHSPGQAELHPAPAVIEETVALKLDRVDSHWKVMDPPRPKISIGVLIKFYESEIGHGHASSKELSKALEVLRSLNP